jgi:hypothetical protein
MVSLRKGREARYVWGPDMSDRILWNLAKGSDMAERLDMPGMGARDVQGMPLEFGLEAGHIRLPKSDSPVCKTRCSSFDRQRIKMDLRKA